MCDPPKSNNNKKKVVFYFNLAWQKRVAKGQIVSTQVRVWFESYKVPQAPPEMTLEHKARRVPGARPGMDLLSYLGSQHSRLWKERRLRYVCKRPNDREMKEGEGKRTKCRWRRSQTESDLDTKLVPVT